MNQGGNSAAETCEGLPPPTLADSSDQNPPVQSSSSAENQTQTAPTTRRLPRFGTSGAPKRFGGSLAGRKKWPPRRVSFPSNDTHLVTGYLEPANPWEYAENVNREDLISTYRKSCIRHNTDPLESVLAQLENLEITEDRCDTLSLNGQKLEQSHCESLEEILKRVQFNNISLEGTSIDDESCVALFDMMEYYESAVHLNISSNQHIGTRGWQACSHMIKKTQCLEQLEAKNVTLNEQHMPILSRALRIASHLQVLKLENCGLSGRPTVILVAALKLNTGLKELYLADNDLGPQDAMQLGALLRTNNHLQLLDVSNNNVQDSGVGHISDGLIEQRLDDKEGKGLGILVLWNNHISRNSSQHFSRALARCKTLEMLNIGQNMLTNETLHIIKESLQQNRTLLRLGMQSTHLTCEAAIALADIIAENRTIQRIDLRDNHLQIAGLAAIAYALKKNKNVTQLDLDDQPRKRLDGTLEQYLALVTEIRGYCTHNDEPSSTDDSTEESESPQHRSRLSSVSSRKISLTCQTLPRSPPPIFPDGPSRTLLEPKRTSGGRLRSPAPSPIPSPVASPIPSPSRGRFVVSRVSETSLSSTNSSASSSPLTPPSRSSSPTCFFPPATGASRFRVTVVEQASSKPAPKSVITSTNTNVTVGFQFRVDSGDQTNSDDSDDVFKPDPTTNSSNTNANESKPDTETHVSPSVNPGYDNTTHLSEITVKVQKTGDMRCVVKDIVSNDSERNNDLKISNIKKDSDVCEKKTPKPSADDDDAWIDVKFDFSSMDNASSNLQQSSVDQNTSRNSDVVSVEVEEAEVKRHSTDNGVAQTRSRKNSCVQKPPSSLEKLLGLFQHPGSLFSGSANEKLDLKNPLQNSVSSVMALGDKFQQYLRDGRGSRESSPQPPLQRSVSDAEQPVAKLDPVKSSSVPQLSSIQALTSIFSSSGLEAKEKDSRNGSLTCSATLGKNWDDPERSQIQIPWVEAEFDSNTNDKKTTPITPQCKREEESSSHRISEQPLPETIVQSKVNNTNRSDDLGLKDNVDNNTTVLDSNNEIVNIKDNKQTICVPKLKDIPEYSVLEISRIEVEPGGERERENVEKLERIICDSSTTDSINLTSDRNSSPRNIICDKQNVVKVVTLGASDIVDNLITPSFESTGDNISTIFTETAVDSLQINLYNDRDDDVDSGRQKNSKIQDIQNQYESMIFLENTITDALYNIDDNNGVTGSENLGNTATDILHTLEETENDNANACHLDNILHPVSTTTIDDMVHSSGPVLENIFKNNVSNIENRDVHIRNSSLVYQDKLMENCNDLISMHEPLVVNHHNQFPAPQNARQNGDSTENDIVRSDYETVELCQTVEANSRHQENSVEQRGFLSVDGSVEFDRSDGDELIFNMTDISTDAVIEDRVSSLDTTMNQSNESIERQQSNSSGSHIQAESSLSQAVQSPTNLFIEKSKCLHRNSHDSGIEETNLSVSADSIPESRTAPLFQESTESGIDSEWSFACQQSDSSNELLKDNVAVSAEKDAINNNRETDGEFGETIKEIESSQDSEVSSGIQSTKETIVRRTVSTESRSMMEMSKTIIVTSICSRNDHGEMKTTESENAIEKLLVEVSSEGRDNEISGCPGVVCSTSHQ